MNKKIQSYLWQGFGAVANFAFPVAYAGIKWDFITESAASTQVSFYVLLAAIAALPALRQYKPKIKFNYIGVIVAAIGAIGYFVGEIMLQMGACIIAGSVSCSICNWQADKLLTAFKEDTLATNIANKMATPALKE